MSLPRLKLNPETNEVERRDPKSKQPPSKVVAIGPPPERKRKMVVRPPFDKAFKEDLEWAEQFVSARLYEIDLQFGPTSNIDRPRDGQGSTYYERELAFEERELKCLLGEIEWRIPKSPSANDTPARTARLDAAVETDLETIMASIKRWMVQGEFREARLRRVLLPQLKIDLRARNFRYG